MASGHQKRFVVGRGRGAVMTLVAVLGLTPLVAVPAMAQSGTEAGDLTNRGAVSVPVPPPDFTLTHESGHQRLLWRSPGPGLHDARVEFFAGDRWLGVPRPTAGGNYLLELPPGSVTDPAHLQVRAAGRRLDRAGVQARHRRSTSPAPSPRPEDLRSVAADPGLPGPYTTVTGEYRLPAVKLPDYPVPVEMQAVVVAPTGAPGPRPFAVFLHGQHTICFGEEPDEYEEPWPCPGQMQPVPSYRGYLSAQRLLASQGYVSISISANGINAQDWHSDTGNDDLGAQARSSLIRLHLAHWADWSGAGRASAPAVVRRAPRADLSQVLLVGHSRGGEGANRAAIDSLSPPPGALDGYQGPVRWTIRGTVQVAPTLFGKNPAADVPSVVLLPGCDGDVFDLHGQATVDGTRAVSTGTALHSAVFVVGANHNYFNAEWTPGQAVAEAGDDWADENDPVCGTASPTSRRLSPAQQQSVGATYVAAAARLFVQNDDQVRPLLDGSGVQAPSAGPAQVLSHAVGAARTTFVLPSADLRVSGSARLCRQVTRADTACVRRDSGLIVPSFVPMSPLPEEPERYAVELTRPDDHDRRPARLQPRQAVSLAGDQMLALRMIVPANTPTTAFEVSVSDTGGRAARLGRVHLSGLPGSTQTVSSWAQEVRVPLAAAQRAGVDLHRIAGLQVAARTDPGQTFLLDAWGWRPGTPPVREAARSRIDVGAHASVTETDDVATYRVPVSFSGPGTGQVRLTSFAYTYGLYGYASVQVRSSTMVTVRAGRSHIDVPLQVIGDTSFSLGSSTGVVAQVVHGAVVAGAYRGEIAVTEDDPPPALAVTPIADRVQEGQALRWRVSLSEPAASPLPIIAWFEAQAGLTELSTADVPADWLRSDLGEDPAPERALSAVQGYLDAEIPAGQTELEISIPTVADSQAEGEEGLAMPVFLLTPGPEPAPYVEVTGRVLDDPPARQ